MTKKERVRRALAGQPVDKVPVSFWRHFAGADSMSQKQVAQEHLKFYQQTDLDFIKIMSDGFTAPFDLDIKTPSDLRKIRPVGSEHPYVAGILERASYVNDLLGDKVDTWFNIFSPFMLLRKLGDDQLTFLLKEDRQAVIDALQAVGETLANMVQALLRDCGCTGVFACFQGAEYNRFSTETFNEVVHPSDLMVLEAANAVGNLNFAHFCGWDGNKNDLSRWRDYPACAVNWAIYVDDLTLPEGKSYFGGRPVLGGFDNRQGKLLFAGEKADIQAETRRLIDDYREKTGSTNGLIIGGDCSYLPPFQLERVNWVSETIRKMAEEETYGK